MKTQALRLCVILIAFDAFANAQAVGRSVAAGPSSLSNLSLFEPPEMKMPIESDSTTPSAADLAFYDALKQFEKKDYDPTSLPALDKIIQDYPSYANAHFWRASTELCGDRLLDSTKAKADLQMALQHYEKNASLFEPKDIYSMLARIEDESGNRASAISLLENAMMADLSSADRIFNIQGVSPETTSKFCTWNLTDLQKLATGSPRDWRPEVFESLYYKFFTTFNESYYPQATAPLQKAALLNSKTPVVPYLQGKLQMQSAFWTKKSWSSDVARNGMYRAAIPYFTKAIELDPNFEPAYAERAEAYLASKQDALAIRDFTSVLSLRPNNSTAYADRGLANSNLGKYFDAISDFGDSIRLKNQGDDYVPSLYENRGDAYIKVANYRSAIDDYSTAIELHLRAQILLLSLQQFRGIYPEYAGVSDELLLGILRSRFYPLWSADAFKKRLTEENGKWRVPFLLQALYEKRGDAYLSIGNYRRGIVDFQRIFVGMPDYGRSTERWRFIGTYGSAEKYYIDVKSSEPHLKAFPRIWVKRIGSKGSDVMAFELDCTPRKYRVSSNVVYDKDGNVAGSDSGSDLWSNVIPDTLSEQLWDGVCQSN